MGELISKMFSDTLWIYTAISGASLDYLVNRWGWTWLQEPDDIWRKRYPRITKKIDELEERINSLEK
jgi:hypothetical protein